MSAPGQVLKWRDAIRATLSRGAYKNLTGELPLAVLWQESAGEPSAWNPEPHYIYLWDVKKDRPFRKLTPTEITSEKPPADFPCLAGDRDQEWWAQQASWGLMQIMGGAAREQGFRGDYLPELIRDPYSNIEFGIKHLWNYAFQYGNRTPEQALLRWNGGGDPEYPAKVFAKLAAIQSS